MNIFVILEVIHGIEQLLTGQSASFGFSVRGRKFVVTLAPGQ